MMDKKKAADLLDNLIGMIEDSGGRDYDTALRMAINALSAQPSLDEWCYSCKEYDSERHCCPRFNRVIRETLKDMKDAQPEIIYCKDCLHNGSFDTDCPIEWNGKEYCSFAERRTDETTI